MSRDGIGDAGKSPGGSVLGGIHRGFSALAGYHLQNAHQHAKSHEDQVINKSATWAF